MLVKVLRRPRILRSAEVLVESGSCVDPASKVSEGIGMKRGSLVRHSINVEIRKGV